MKYRDVGQTLCRTTYQPRRREFLSALMCPLLSPVLVSTARAPAGYSNEPFRHAKIKLDVWKGGNPRDPLVFIFHDIAGLRQTCFDLGDVLIKKGFSVAIPRFFGDFGGGWMGYIKGCEGRAKFQCYDANDSGAIVHWIKALAHHGSGTGKYAAIGNCMTGILPLLMLRSPRCEGAVLCQPAFPFASLFARDGYRAALGLSEIDQAYAALATARRDLPVLGIRYRVDPKCQEERFDSLRCLLGDRFHWLQIDGKGHSTVLGDHKSQDAIDAVMEYLEHRLKGERWTPPPRREESPACTPDGGQR